MDKAIDNKSKTTLNSISCVIFDCDGVLFDSRQANIDFYNHLLDHFGLPPLTADKVAFVHMHTVQESVNHIFAGTPHLEAAHEFRLKVDYTPFIQSMIMEPGLKELLETLKPRYGLGLATNRSTTIETVLERNGLDPYFDIVVSSLDVEKPKPHPESLFKILDFFNIPPNHAVYVGDSEVDFLTARAAGVPLIAYKNRALKAPIHVDRLMEIKDILWNR